MSLAYASGILGRKFGVYQKLVSSAPPYTPNYPSGLTPAVDSTFNQLIGWYDSSTANTSSILLNDVNGNPVNSGTNGAYVNTWKNIFLGATQGGTHLPDMGQATLGSQPTYSTSKKYGVNQLTGNSHPGIVFDGSATSLSLPSQALANFGTTFTWLYAFPVSTTVQSPVVNFEDQGTNNFTFPSQGSGTILGSQLGQRGGMTNSVTNSFGYNGSNTVSMAQCGYLFYSNQSVKLTSVYYNGSSYISDNGAAGGHQFSSLTANYYDTSSDYDSPWNIISLGGDALATVFGAGPIGEFLCYRGTLSPNAVKTALQYLISRWN
jgi:hypothetical protein